MKKMPGPAALLYGAALLCVPHVARADSENVIVTGTRLAGEQAGSNVAILDAAAIRARNPGSVVDLLRDLPSVHVQQSGGRGSAARRL